jgi:predicted metal-dependent phosphoesterase TrpH
MPPLLRVEFHCHTRYSKDSLVEPAALVETCRRRGIDRLVVTDHNTISGALAAKEIAPDLVIVGEEIMTTHGELLAAFVMEEVPRDLPPEEAIGRLKQQGAFISVSHPFDRFRGKYWSRGLLAELTPQFDAIEIFNARCLPPRLNREAEEFARLYNLAGTAGSDAHTHFEVGRAVMLLPPFNDAVGLREAIRSVRYETRLSPWWVRFGSRYAVMKKALTSTPS